MRKLSYNFDSYTKFYYPTGYGFSTEYIYKPKRNFMNTNLSIDFLANKYLSKETFSKAIISVLNFYRFEDNFCEKFYYPIFFDDYYINKYGCNREDMKNNIVIRSIRDISKDYKYEEKIINEMLLDKDVDMEIKFIITIGSKPGSREWLEFKNNIVNAIGNTILGGMMSRLEYERYIDSNILKKIIDFRNYIISEYKFIFTETVLKYFKLDD